MSVEDHHTAVVSSIYLKGSMSFEWYFDSIRLDRMISLNSIFYTLRSVDCLTFCMKNLSWLKHVFSRKKSRDQIDLIYFWLFNWKTSLEEARRSIWSQSRLITVIVFQKKACLFKKNNNKQKKSKTNSCCPLANENENILFFEFRNFF